MDVDASTKDAVAPSTIQVKGEVDLAAAPTMAQAARATQRRVEAEKTSVLVGIVVGDLAKAAAATATAKTEPTQHALADAPSRVSMLPGVMAQHEGMPQDEGTAQGEGTAQDGGTAQDEATPQDEGAAQGEETAQDEGTPQCEATPQDEQCNEQANNLLQAVTSHTRLRTTIDAVNTNGPSATHVAPATTRGVVGREEEVALPPGLVVFFTCLSVLLLLMMSHGKAENRPTRTALTGWRRARQLCGSRSPRRFAACVNMRRRGSRIAVGLCLLFCCGGGWNVGLFVSAAALTDATFKQASWGTCHTPPIVFANCTHSRQGP